MFVEVSRCLVFYKVCTVDIQINVFIYSWDSRANDDHHHKVQWLPREELQVEKFNVV